MKNIILIIFILISSLYSQNKKEINAVLGIDKPPFIFAKTSKKGIEAELLIEIFDSMNYKLNIIQKPKAYMQTILDQRSNIDLVSTISIKNDKLFYSNPFISYKNYVITRKNEHYKINSIDDLRAIKFVIWNGAYNDLGRTFYNLFNPTNGSSKYSYNDNNSQKDDIKMFFSNKVDAIIIDKTIFNWLKIHYDNKEEYTFHNIFKKENTYPVTFRSKKLRDEFNIALNNIKTNGRYKEIINFYETQDIEDLLKYSTLLSNISSKYLFNLKKDKLKKLLKLFFIHPDIISIFVINKDNTINIKLYKDKLAQLNFDKSKYSNIERKIYYNSNNEIIQIGNLHIYYKKNYKTNNGILIHKLNIFKNNKDFKYIKNIYTKLNLLDNNKIILTKKENEYIHNHKVITVHNESTWAPYNFNEKGVPKGFVIDYMDLIAKKLGINLKYINGYSWSEFINLIKTDKIDIIANILKTKNREEYISFTSPYMSSKKAIFSNIKGIKKLSDLNGKIVAVPNDFYIYKYLKKQYPKIKVKLYKNTQECLYALINKEADAIVENFAVVDYLIKKNGLKIKYTTISEDKELITDISIGVRKSQTILRDILQKAQSAITKDEFEKLENKWFGLKNKNILSKKEKEYIKNKKILNICINSNWAPIEFFENKKAKGISIDILKYLANKINIEIKFIQTNSILQTKKYIKNNICDLSTSSIKIKQDKLHYTEPYLSLDLAIITKNNKPLVNNISYIMNKTMSREKYSGISKMLKQEYPNIIINNTNNMKESFNEISNNKSYYTISTLPVLSYNKKREDISNLQVAGYSKLKCDLRMLVNEENKILLNILSKSINLISKDSIKVISDKWSTQEVIKKTDYKLVWMILVISFIIITIIVISYLKQKKLKEKIYTLNISLNDRVKEEVQKNKEKEKIMLQQSRLAQTGETISMIAHQWRQPLNSLSMLSQLVVFKYNKNKLDDEFIEYFKINSKKQIRNMSKTIDNFRNFFKPEKEKVKFCLNNVIDDAIDMIQPIFTKYNIEISFNVDNKINIYGYQNELGQAILNIMNNAKDALIDNKIKSKYINILLEENKENIILSIQDNANGISVDIIGNIFDPYFSTKEDKNGTGLGLYMTKMIIEEHMKGLIKVENNEQGALFIIKFIKN